MSNPLESQADMTGELQQYCLDHGLPQFSADELAVEVGGVIDGWRSEFIAFPDCDARRRELETAHAWLLRFCERWESAI